jgi:hypothetical protein
MRQGLNTLTLTVENWKKYSMSYGSSTGVGTDQVPYIIQTSSPMASMSTPMVSLTETQFIQNESLEVSTGTTPVG